MADNNNHHSILGNFTKRLEAKTTCNELSKELIRKELQLHKYPDVDKRIIWPKNKVAPSYLILIGSECTSLHGRDIPNGELNLPPFMYSPDMKLKKVDIAANGDIFPVGTMGVDKRKMNENHEKQIYPEFKVPKEMKDLKSIPKHLKLETEKMSELFQKSNEEDLNFNSYINYINIMGREPTTIECHSFELHQLQKEIEECNREIEKEEMIKDYITSYQTTNKRERIEDMHVYMTLHDTITLNKSIELTGYEPYKQKLCNLHKQVIQNCQGCQKGSRYATVESELLYQKYFNSLEAVPNEDGTYSIKCTHDFWKGKTKAGELENSMFLTAEKSVKKLFEKAKKAGLLQDLENHMIKMEKSGAIVLLDNEEMEKILKGEKLSNFCSQNYVEKQSSKRSKIRPVNDTSRIMPNLGYSLVDLMECPKDCINTLLNAYLCFTMNQSHCEGDILKAYWNVAASESQSESSLIP